MHEYPNNVIKDSLNDLIKINPKFTKLNFKKFINFDFYS